MKTHTKNLENKYLIKLILIINYYYDKTIIQNIHHKMCKKKCLQTHKTHRHLHTQREKQRVERRKK